MGTAFNEDQRSCEEQDKRWSAPRFFGFGFVTLLVALSVIIYFATRTGCTLQVVP